MSERNICSGENAEYQARYKNWYLINNPKMQRIFYWMLKNAKTEITYDGYLVIQKGELLASVKQISAGTGISEGSIKTAIKHLQEIGAIQTRRLSRYRLISVHPDAFNDFLLYMKRSSYPDHPENRPVARLQSSVARPDSSSEIWPENHPEDYEISSKPEAADYSSFETVSQSGDETGWDEGYAFGDERRRESCSYRNTEYSGASSHRTYRASSETSILDGFVEFMEAYPLKLGKEQARQIWCCLRPDAALRKQIMWVLYAWKGSESWKVDNGKYIPLAKNWLSNRKWEVDPVEEDRRFGLI